MRKNLVTTINIIRKKRLGDEMIKILFFIITIFALVMVLYKRIAKCRYISIRDLLYNINKQYKDIFRGKKSDLKIWQWWVFVISQMIIIFAVVRSLFEKLYEYISEDYVVAIKVSTDIIIFVLIYFIVGYFMYSTKKIYKFLYKIEDKNTKTDLIISFFIISIYTTILILFPEQFAQIYIIGLVGVSISYILNLKVLISVIRSPQIIEVKINNNSKVEENDVGLISGILLFMVIVSLYLGVCFISNGSIVAKFMSIVISLTSIICLTIFISSMLSYKSEK